MNLAEWLDCVALDPQKGLCVTMATDGLSKKSSKVIGISLYGYLSLDDDTRTKRTVFINGGDPGKVEKFTGVSEQMHAKTAVHIERAQEIFEEAIQASEFLVCYSASSFTLPWASEVSPMAGNTAYLDVVDICRLYDSGQGYPAFAESLDDLVIMLPGALKGLPRSGYSVDALVSRFCGEIDEGPTVMESKIVQLEQLYQRMLAID